MENYTKGNYGNELIKEVEEKQFEIKTFVSGRQIENIIVDGIETGIGYWARVNVPEEVTNLCNNEKLCLTEAITEVILNGGEIEIVDDEEDVEAKYKLSLERILRGIELNSKERNWDSNLDQGDATTMDCIIQYAIFGDVIFG